jgi:hypothetical protein
MANTRIQMEIEKWIRTEWMPRKFKQEFRALRVQLNTGGHFDFDAVNRDGSIIANISTSSAKTTGGKNGTAKFQKLRSDMLFLTMVTAKQKLIILSEKDMFEMCLKEKRNGRVPGEIEFEYAEIPESFQRILNDSKKIAAKEVTPGKN